MINKKEKERRRKISESLKKTLAKPEEKAKRIAQLTGRKMSAEARKKQSESKLIKNGMKGKHRTLDNKEKSVLFNENDMMKNILKSFKVSI